MPSGQLLNTLLKVRDSVKNRSFTRNLNFLEKSQWYSRDEALTFQWKELEKLLDVAFTKVPYYRKKFQEMGIQRRDIRSLQDYRQLPVLTRTDITQNLSDLTPEDVSKESLHVHATGGSSGTPLRFYRTIESFDWRSACTKRAYSWSGLKAGDPTLHLWGAPAGKQSLQSRLKADLDHWMRGEVVIPTFLHDDKLWKHVYDEWKRHRPTHVVGYVSSLVRFARFVENSDLPPLPPAQGILAAAEQLDESIREYVESALRSPVFNTYGSREFMSVAAECEKKHGLHINSENLVVETAGSPGTEASDILITDLHNYGTIFLRYSIGDLGIISDRVCECGRGLPLLESIQGRSVDVLKLANGRSITGLFFRHILKELPEVMEYQVWQDSLEKITLNVVLSGPLSEQSQNLMDNELGKLLGPVKYELKQVSELQQGRSGKNKTIVSLEDQQ